MKCDVSSWGCKRRNTSQQSPNAGCPDQAHCVKIRLAVAAQAEVYRLPSRTKTHGCWQPGRKAGGPSTIPTHPMWQACWSVLVIRRGLFQLCATLSQCWPAAQCIHSVAALHVSHRIGSAHWALLFSARSRLQRCLAEPSRRCSRSRGVSEVNCCRARSSFNILANSRGN